MTLKTYSGSCHCGVVRFEADIDLEQGTSRCNCSVCAKARSWFVVVDPDHVRMLTGADHLSEYRWTPAGRSRPYLHYRFCGNCGIRTVGRGDESPHGGPFSFVAVAALDDADPDELAASIRYLDGRHDRYDRRPEDTRLM